MPNSFTGRYKTSVSHSQVPPYLRNRKSNAIAEKTYDRALSLMLVVLQKGRWKSSVLNKAGNYLYALTRNTGYKATAGIPDVLLHAIHRCFAQACLEIEPIGLSGQQAPWYEEVLKTVRQKDAQ